MKIVIKKKVILFHITCNFVLLPFFSEIEVFYAKVTIYCFLRKKYKSECYNLTFIKLVIPFFSVQGCLPFT